MTATQSGETLKNHGVTSFALITEIIITLL